MSVVYDVPRFSQKSAKQKGPTCWYYALKMLLKFHDLFDRGKKEPENPLEVLHSLRQVMTRNDAGSTRTVYDKSAKRFRHPLDARVAEIEEKQKRALSPVTADQQANSALPPHIVAFLREKENEALAGQLALVKDQIQTDLDPVRMKPVIALVDKKLEQEMSHFDYLAFALPHITFRQVKTPKTVEELEKSLRKFGPMYASGSLSIMKVTPDASGRSGSNERVVAVKELRGDGMHAVVIAGVTDQEELFYKDPNRADELRCIHFRRFMAEQQRVQLLAIDCANRGSFDDSKGVMVESCHHCRQRLITQKVVPPMSVTK